MRATINTGLVLAFMVLSGCIVVDDLADLWSHGAGDQRLFGSWTSRNAGSRIEVSQSENGAGLVVAMRSQGTDQETLLDCRTFAVSNTCFVAIRVPVIDEAVRKKKHSTSFSAGGLMRYDISNSSAVVFSTLNSNGWKQVITLGVNTELLSRDRATSTPNRGSRKLPHPSMSDLSMLAALGREAWSIFAVWEKQEDDATRPASDE